MVSTLVLKNIQDNLYLLKKVIKQPNEHGETFLNCSDKMRQKEIKARLANEPELKRNIETAKNTDEGKLLWMSAKHMIGMRYSEQAYLEDGNIVFESTSKTNIPNPFYFYNISL